MNFHFSVSGRRAAAVIAWACLAAGAAQAEGLKPQGVFAQAGLGRYGTYQATAGVYWPWEWKSSGGGWTGYTELLGSAWTADAVAGGHKTFAHVALSPIFRYHFDSGSSPWFFEGGIGLSYTSPLYVTAHKAFGSKFNFADTIGVGRTFGAGGNQAITLRLQHISNAGIKKPNPGDEFLQLRYSSAF